MKKLLTKVFLIFMLVMTVSMSVNGLVFAKTTVPTSVTTTLSTFVYSDASLLSETYKKLDANVDLAVDTTFVDTNEMFYRVSLVGIIEGKVDGDYGYVLIAHTIDSNVKSPERKLDGNAKIKNDDSFLFTKIAEEYVKTDIKLNKDTDVKVLDGYDKNKEYTYIAYKQENGNIAYFYVETVNLKVFGVNYSLIVGILSMVAAVSIVLAILGVKGKKKKR